jgi:hypothetical protein
MFFIIACSTNPSEQKDGVSDSISDGWIIRHDTVKDLFVLSFSGPADWKLEPVIDNCRCLKDSKGNANDRQWCICMQDTLDSSMDELISSWKLTCKNDATEKREVVSIGGEKGVQVVLSCGDKLNSYRKLIYFRKQETLFEVMNTNAELDSDFIKFCNSINVEKTK